MTERHVQVAVSLPERLLKEIDSFGATNRSALIAELLDEALVLRSAQPLPDSETLRQLASRSHITTCGSDRPNGFGCYYPPCQCWCHAMSPSGRGSDGD